MCLQDMARQDAEDSGLCCNVGPQRALVIIILNISDIACSFCVQTSGFIQRLE